MQLSAGAQDNAATTPAPLQPGETILAAGAASDITPYGTETR